jgi:hypothetical protein
MRMCANAVTTEDAAMTLLFHFERQWRGASEFGRWANDDMRGNLCEK